MLLNARGLSKSFAGHRVLDDVDLELRSGQVHGLVGENGAGKSTLMKLLAGVYTPDEGTIELGGEPVSFSHPLQAQHAGVSTVFQEFNLLPERSVAENVWLGREPRRRGFVDTARMQADTADLLRDLGVTHIRPGQRVRSLSVAEQQIVEIAKAVSFDSRVIQMDEPTAALADHEVELLYGIIAGLTERGVGIVYVSHRLKEVFDLCDTITVLKDGRAGHHPASRRARRRRVGPADGRPADLHVLPRQGAGHRARARPSSSSATPATATSTASTSPCAPARSSASPGCRAPAAPSCSRRSSGSARSPAARCCSTASRCARAPRATRSAPGWR